MSDIKLSIYIPTYNRCNYLNQLLENLKKEIKDYKQYIEVVISDNCSPDNTGTVIPKLCEKYCSEGYNYVYHRNPTNIGGCRNYIQCTDYVSGEYCWIIGDDDIIFDNGINAVMNMIIEGKSDVDYFSVNFAYISMSERQRILDDGMSTDDVEDEKLFFKMRTNAYIEGYEKLFSIPGKIPSHVATYLGQNLFKTALWAENRKKVNLERGSVEGVIATDDRYVMSIDYVFPHIKILADSIMHARIGYIGTPCVGLGVGAMDNATDNWHLIDSVVADEIAEYYKKCDMDDTDYNIFLNSFLKRCGANIGHLCIQDAKSGFGRKDAMQYVHKYAKYPEFMDAFMEKMSFYLRTPSESRYVDFCSKAMCNTIQKNITAGQKIAIWGTGEIAECIIEKCESLTDNLSAVVDGISTKWGKTFGNMDNLKISSPQCLKALRPDIVIVASVEYAEDIVRDIHEMGIVCDIISSKGFIKR